MTAPLRTTLQTPLERFSAGYLFLLAVVTIAVMFANAKWATSVPELASFALASLWVFLFIRRRVRPRFEPILLPLAAIVLLARIQLLAGITVYAWSTRMSLLYWAANLAVFFCGLQVFADRLLRDLFLKLLLFFAVAVCIFSTLQHRTSGGLIYWMYPGPEFPNPVFGPFVSRNQFVAFIELLLPIAIYLAFTAKTRAMIYWPIIAILYASVLTSASRSGFALATLELAVVPFLSLRRSAPGDAFSRTKLLNGALVLITVLLWLAIPAQPDHLIDRLGNKDPYGGRREYTESSLLMIRARPLTGFGLGTWSTAYRAYALFDNGLYANQAHNDWAQWTTEGGLPMLGLMLCIAAWGTRRGLRTGWGFGIPVIFMECLFDYPIQRPGVAVVFFLVLAALAGPREADDLEQAGT